jgi:hypothetical protein
VSAGVQLTAYTLGRMAGLDKDNLSVAGGKGGMGVKALIVTGALALDITAAVGGDMSFASMQRLTPAFIATAVVDGTNHLAKKNNLNNNPATRARSNAFSLRSPSQPRGPAGDKAPKIGLKAPAVPRPRAATP